MAKGYLITGIDVIDPLGYFDYPQESAALYASHGGRYLIQGGDFDHMEGIKRHRNVVVEFPSFDAALGCVRSDGFQSLIEKLAPYVLADVAVVEGYDGPQPGAPLPAESEKAPYGYWVVRLDVMNPTRYQDYIPMVGAVLKRHGGNFKVRGGKAEIIAGKGRGRYIVLAFPDLATARAAYADPDYAAAVKVRQEAAEGDFIIIQGYTGPNDAA